MLRAITSRRVSRNLLKLSNKFKPWTGPSMSSSSPSEGSRFFELNSPTDYLWRPSALFQEGSRKLDQRYMCLLLNINKGSYEEFRSIKYIWDNSDYRVAVDGAANSLCYLEMDDSIDLLCGDFDSIDGKLLKNLTSKTTVIETADQSETDFTKALNVASLQRPTLDVCVAIFKNDGTRIDHLFGIINTLHKIDKPIVVLDTSRVLFWLLRPGRHSISKQKGREACSLIPFEGPARVTTNGLYWDMNNALIQFGGLISTSNMVSSDNNQPITIETDRPILWTIDLKF